MARLLIHVTTAPEDQTKAAMSFLVARTALAEGHEVNLFLSGDSVQLLSTETLQSLEGNGTGKLSEHYESIVKTGGKFYLSGVAAKARGFDDALIKGKPAEFVTPDVLIKLIMESDKSLAY